MTTYGPIQNGQALSGEANRSESKANPSLTKQDGLLSGTLIIMVSLNIIKIVVYIKLLVTEYNWIACTYLEMIGAKKSFSFLTSKFS